MPLLASFRTCLLIINPTTPPDPEPTLRVGVRALTSAALAYLPDAEAIHRELPARLNSTSFRSILLAQLEITISHEPTLVLAHSICLSYPASIIM